MADRLEIEPLLPIWPTLESWGYRSRSAAYDAVKKGHIPGVVHVGRKKMLRPSALNQAGIREGRALAASAAAAA